MQAPEIVGGAYRVELRAVAFFEGNRLPECDGNDEDVAEQNRRVEPKSTNRLKRRFCRERRREAKIDETRSSCTNFAIFGEIASGLPHEPKRWLSLGLPIENLKKLLGWVVHVICPMGKKRLWIFEIFFFFSLTWE